MGFVSAIYSMFFLFVFNFIFGGRRKAGLIGYQAEKAETDKKIPFQPSHDDFLAETVLSFLFFLRSAWFLLVFVRFSHVFSAW